MRKKLWTIDKQKLVTAYLAQGLTYAQIAGLMNISLDAVEKATRRYSLRKGNKSPYSPKTQKEQPKDMARFVIETLKEELKNATPYKAAEEKSTDKKGDTLVIQLTDLHAGKIVKDQDGKLVYNEEIFRTRINRLCEQTLKLLDHNISKGVPIRDVVILSCGDLANGEGIYATQAFEQELAPPSQTMLVVEVIQKLILSLLDRKLPVRFVGIRGNHGRTGKDTDIASNWDLMIYKVLEFWSLQVLKNKNLVIQYAETEHMKIDIRGHGYLIRHIAPEQVDSPAGRVKINEWARRHDVEGIAYGHYHHAGIFDCDGIRVFRGGSTVGVDSLSENMAKSSAPLQLVWGVNEARVSTFIYLVDLGTK